jgi:hypothetical protein
MYFLFVNGIEKHQALRYKSWKFETKKMKKHLLILISILFIGCNQADKKNEIQKNTSYQFFEFDEIDHYQVEITVREYLDINTQDQTPDETKFLGILNGNYPESINDKSFLKYLQKFYPKKRKIDSNKFKAIANIYTEKKHKNPMFAACDPLYRDILIFKKNNVITGISKICFECYIQTTIGSIRNTENLGQSGDMGRLDKILSK